MGRIFSPELELNKAYASDTEAPFFDLHLSILDGFVSSKIYNKRNDFDFEIDSKFSFFSVFNLGSCMTTCLGNSYSFGVLCMPFVNINQFLCVILSLNGFDGRVWDLIVSIPYRFLSYYFRNKISINSDQNLSGTLQQTDDKIIS